MNPTGRSIYLTAMYNEIGIMLLQIRACQSHCASLHSLAIQEKNALAFAKS
jgi:hypothetical protein